jgi:hypothetical protein
MEALRYAYEHGCPWHTSACTVVVQHQRDPLPWLQYAHDNGCPWGAETTRAAALAGKLEVLRFLHEHGCPWDARTCSAAAESHHVECLRYAHEHGCRWDKSTILSGCVRGAWTCVEYAQKNKCPWNKYACAEAVRKTSVWNCAAGRLPPAELMRALRIPLDSLNPPQKPNPSPFYFPMN